MRENLCLHLRADCLQEEFQSQERRSPPKRALRASCTYESLGKLEDRCGEQVGENAFKRSGEISGAVRKIRRKEPDSRAD